MLPDILNPLVDALTGLGQTLKGAIQALKDDDQAMRQAEQTLTASGQGFGGFSQVRSGPAIFGMFLGTAANAYTRSVDINLAASDFSLESLMYVWGATSAAVQSPQPLLTLTRPSLPSLSPTQLHYLEQSGVQNVDALATDMWNTLLNCNETLEDIYQHGAATLLACLHDWPTLDPHSMGPESLRGAQEAILDSFQPVLTRWANGVQQGMNQYVQELQIATQGVRQGRLSDPLVVATMLADVQSHGPGMAVRETSNGGLVITITGSLPANLSLQQSVQILEATINAYAQQHGLPSLSQGLPVTIYGLNVGQTKELLTALGSKDQLQLTTPDDVPAQTPLLVASRSPKVPKKVVLLSQPTYYQFSTGTASPLTPVKPLSQSDSTAGGKLYIMPGDPINPQDQPALHS